MTFDRPVGDEAVSDGGCASILNDDYSPKATGKRTDQTPFVASKAWPLEIV